MNILDDHSECYKHRVCNKDFPCEVCKGWSQEKRDKVEKMIEKSKQKNVTSSAAVITSSSSPSLAESQENSIVSNSPMGNVSQTNSLSSPPGFTIPFFPGASGLMGPRAPTMPTSSNIDINNQTMNTGLTDTMNPFMWMFNSMMQTNMQSMIDKRVDEMFRNSGHVPVSNTNMTTTTTTASVASHTTCMSVSDSVGQPICNTSTVASKRFNRFTSSSQQYEDISDNESEDGLSVNAPNDFSDHNCEETESQISEKTQNSDHGVPSMCDLDTNNNLAWSSFMSKVANELNIEVDDSQKGDKSEFTSYVPEHVAQKSNKDSVKVRLPLDGVILESLHAIDKEFQKNGNIKAFKSRDDEKFQVKNDHYQSYCSVPKLDPNVEEGLTSFTYSKNQGALKRQNSKNSGFRFKNRALFDHNNEMKRVDVQARLLLRACSYGTLITSYLGKLYSNDETVEALQALYQVFNAMTDVSSRLIINSVSSRRNLHLQEMGFKNPSTEGKLRRLSTLGSNIFGGQYFELLHDSAENIRDARETQHLRKSFVNKSNSENKNSLKRKVSKDESELDEHKGSEHNGSQQTNPKKFKYDKSKSKSNDNKTRKSNDFQAKKGQLGFRPPK